MASGRLAVPKRNIVRRLRDEGFELERQCGSHQQWKNYHTKRTVTVPDRPELIGEQVKTIYKQAGWSWQDSASNTLPKSKQLEGVKVQNQRIPPPHLPTAQSPVVDFKAPTPVVPPAAPTATVIPSATDQTADSPPIAKPETPAVNETPSNENEESEMPRNATARTKKKRKFRDATEINLMAQDMMEHPDETMNVLAARWDGCHQTTFTPIRAGTHAKLDKRTTVMLDIMFGRMSPLSAKAKELVKEFQEKPESIPLGVRRRMEGVVPRPNKEPTPLPAKPEPTAEPAKVEVASAPTPKIKSEPQPVIKHQEPPKQQQLSLLRSEAVVVGYAPRSVGEAPVTIKGASTSLKELLEAARQVMKAMGITKVTLPEWGEIVIERKEILL